MTTPLPSVPNFIAGSGPQQSDMLSLWTNAAAFFQQRVIFRASQTTTPTSLPASGAFTTIGYDNIIEDPYSGWSAGPHNWRPPAGFSGWYQFTATVFLQAPGVSGVGLLVSFIYGGIGSGTVAAIVVPVTAVGAAEATWYAYLVGGQDAVAVQAALQNSAAPVSTNVTGAGQQSTFEITWISS